jgi:zinc/manganese transport system ATP-binding protein
MNPTPVSAPPIALNDVTVGYAGHPVLQHVNWTMRPGSMTALVGPNGGGKSTLLKVIAGELKPLAGRIDRGDAMVAYLPQSPEFDRSFPIRVKDVVAMGLWRRLGAFGQLGQRDAETVRNALGAVGLDGFEGKNIGALSGGELQRVLFARLIVLDASVMLLDEPFAAIDETTVTDLIGIIHSWHRQGRTITAALHDLDQVRDIFPETVRVASGAVVYGTTATILGSAVPAVVPGLASGVSA